MQVGVNGPPVRRVAMFVPTPPGPYPGGAERAMMRLAAGLANRGHSVDFLVARSNSPCWAGISPYVRLIGLNAESVAALPQLLQYIRAQRPDTLLSSGGASLSALLSKRIFFPNLRVVLRQNNAGFGANSKLADRLLRFLMPVADQIVAVNWAVAEEIRRHAPDLSGKTMVVYDPYDLEDLAAKSDEPLDHPWFGEERTAPVIVSVGSLHFKKDLPTLLRAFALVVDQRPARLVIVGDGPDLSRLRDIAAGLAIGQLVDFAGYRPNPYSYIAQSDLAAYCALQSETGCALVEAMACGTPVVSANCPSGPYEILNGGRLGVLLPAGDHRALAGAIMHSLDNPAPRELLVENAARFALGPGVDAYARLCFP